MKSSTETLCEPAYLIDADRIFSERFDGDTIIIDLQTGVYYALNLVGSVIWESISNGLTLNQIEEVIQNKCQDSPRLREVIHFDIRAFLELLINNSLIVETMSAERRSSIEFDFDLSAGSYNAPTLIPHDDIKDVLLADIVHSVGSDGWPEFNR